MSKTTQGQLAKVLELIGFQITLYNPEKQKSILTSRGQTMTVKKFCEMIKKEKEATNYPAVMRASFDEHEMEGLLFDYAKEMGIEPEKKAEMVIPEEIKELTLNCDMTAKGRDDRFFLTYPDETVSRISGEFYLTAYNLDYVDGTAQARKVIPEYLPRHAPGVQKLKSKGKESAIFNKYIPPAWKNHPEYKRIKGERLPILFEKLINHLFPSELEREYFFAWLHASLFDRAFVYLVLCGAPAIGKNRLKLVMRALHGHANAIDGKR